MFDQVKNVSKIYESRGASTVGLYPLDLEIEPCTTVVFLGPSGSGKAHFQSMKKRILVFRRQNHIVESDLRSGRSNNRTSSV